MNTWLWTVTERDGWKEHRRCTNLADFLILEGDSLYDAILVTRNKTLTASELSLDAAKEWCMRAMIALMRDEFGSTYE